MKRFSRSRSFYFKIGIILVAILFIILSQQQRIKARCYIHRFTNRNLPVEERQEALDRLKEMGVAVPYLVRMLDSTDYHLRMTAMQTLNFQPTAKYLPQIIAHIKKEDHEGIRIEGLKVVSRSGVWNNEVAALFEEALTDFRPSIREAGLRRMAEIKNLSLTIKIPRLILMLKDNFSPIRERTAEYLYYLTGKKLPPDYKIWHIWWIKEGQKNIDKMEKRLNENWNKIFGP